MHALMNQPYSPRYKQTLGSEHGSYMGISQGETICLSMSGSRLIPKSIVKGNKINLSNLAVTDSEIKLLGCLFGKNAMVSKYKANAVPQKDVYTKKFKTCSGKGKIREKN